MTQIRNRRALVTGAASGMGRLLAFRLSAEGARLVLVDLNEDGLAEVARAIPNADAYVCDVTDRAAVERLCLDVGAIDILVNNAGVISTGAYAEIAAGDDANMLAVNAAGVHWMTKAFLPALMRAEEGHLVQMASVASIIGIPYQALYSATKWFVAGLGESIRQELRAEGHHHVHVTIVCPSIVDTGFFDRPHVPFLVPMLKPEKIVGRIVEAVRKNRPYVREPLMVKLAPFLRGISPSSLTDLVARLIGVDRVVPREPRRRSTNPVEPNHRSADSKESSSPDSEQPGRRSPLT